MKKRLGSLLLAALMFAALAVPAAAHGFDGFEPQGGYYHGRFYDVEQSHWFSSCVESAYNYGLVVGRSADSFDPDGNLTLGEALKLVCRLRSICTTGGEDFDEGIPFYGVYASYAEDNGFAVPGADYTALTTRAQLAELICAALPEDVLPPINDVPDYAVCDVVPGDEYASAVYTLYRAGILAGSDRYGTFRPSDMISRAEACAIIERVILSDKRLNVRLPDSISAAELYTRSTGAVFMLELFDKNGNLIRTASGFFISDTGLAVTSQHVLPGAVNAIITLSNGQMYPVEGVNAVNYEYDLAIISADPELTGLPYLKLADSDALKTGETVYALTSPLGLLNSMTVGVVSYSPRVIEEMAFIQFTSPISFGSGGGPVLNAKGQVVGVASSSFEAGEGLNLAIPCNLIKLMEIGQCIRLEDVPASAE